MTLALCVLPLPRRWQRCYQQSILEWTPKVYKTHTCGTCTWMEPWSTLPSRVQLRPEPPRQPDAFLLRPSALTSFAPLRSPQRRPSLFFSSYCCLSSPPCILASPSSTKTRLGIQHSIPKPQPTHRLLLIYIYIALYSLKEKRDRQKHNRTFEIKRATPKEREHNGGPFVASV